jgi:hypothetical protein
MLKRLTVMLLMLTRNFDATLQEFVAWGLSLDLIELKELMKVPSLSETVL